MAAQLAGATWVEPEKAQRHSFAHVRLLLHERQGTVLLKTEN